MVRAKASTKNVQCSYYLNVETLQSGEDSYMRGENQRFCQVSDQEAGSESGGNVGTAEILKQSKISLLS